MGITRVVAWVILQSKILIESRYTALGSLRALTVVCGAYVGLCVRAVGSVSVSYAPHTAIGALKPRACMVEVKECVLGPPRLRH